MVKGNSGLQINLSVSVDDNRILEKIESRAVELDSIFEVSQGYIPYRRSDLIKEFGEEKGNKIVDERLWHSKERKNDKFSPEIQGRDLQRYFCSEVSVKKFVKYGDHVAGYVKEKFFNNPRVLIMEITRGDFYRITATYVEEEYYNTPSIINVIHPENDKNQVKYLTGLLNSRLFTWYHEKRHSKSHAKTSIPKILVSEVRNLPLVEEYNEKIAKTVDKFIANNKRKSEIELNKLEKKIDQLVYELYGLSEEEIGIVEE